MTPADLHLHVCFLAPPDAVMARAAQIGRSSGRDDDWVPPSVSDAVFEILVSADDPVAEGLRPTPLPERLGPDASLFALQLRIVWLTSPAETWALVTNPDFPSIDPDQAASWPRTDAAIALAALMSPLSPVDLDFEIVDIARPGSAHARQWERASALASWRCHGAPGT